MAKIIGDHSKERELHVALVKYLRDLQEASSTKGFLFFHVKNDLATVRGDKRAIHWLKAQGVLSGVPDFEFLLPNGKIKFLEIKAKKGKLSDNQKKFISDSEVLGHEVIVAYGWDEILDAVDAILAA